MFDNKRLEQLYTEFNRQYFNDALPKIGNITVKWSGRLTRAAGQYS